MMSNTPGRVRRRLAAALQRDFPYCGELPITWRADRIDEASGWYRISVFADVWRWEAWAFFENGSAALNIGSWFTMTECARAKKLVMTDLRGILEVHPKA